MRAAVLALVLLLPSLAQSAESEARRYAVLSLVGDKFLVAGPRAGAKGQSAGDPVETNDPAIDGGVLLAVDQAVRRHDPKATTVLLLPRNPALFAAQEKVPQERAGSRQLVDDLKSLLGTPDATHLILVAKRREAATMTFADYIVPRSATLEGIGFYLDHGAWVRRIDTGQPTQGFLGVFAYFKVLLIELPRWEILADHPVSASITHAMPGIDPWDSATAEEKSGWLRELVRAEAARAIPALLK